MKPLKKREQKWKDNAREGNTLAEGRRKFAGSQKSGIPTGNRVLNMLRLRQGIPRKDERSVRLFPDYEGPINPSDGDPGENP